VHNVAGEAELRAFGAFHVLGETESGGQHRQDKESHERQDFSAADTRQLNPQTDQRCQGQSDRDNQNLENGGGEESHLESVGSAFGTQQSVFSSHWTVRIERVAIKQRLNWALTLSTDC